MPGAVGTIPSYVPPVIDLCDFTQYTVGASNTVGTTIQNINALTTEQGGFMFEIRAVDNIVIDQITAYTVANNGGAEVYRYNRTYVTGTELGYKDYSGGTHPFDSNQWTQITSVNANSSGNHAITLPLSNNLTEICAGKTATFYVHAIGGGTYPKMRTQVHPQNNAGQFGGGTPSVPHLVYGWGMYLRANSTGLPFLSGSSGDAEANYMQIAYHLMV